MTTKIVKAAVAGPKHNPLAAYLDYENSQIIPINADGEVSAAINSGMVLIYATVPCYIQIGADPEAAAPTYTLVDDYYEAQPSTGSRLFGAHVHMFEGLTSGDKISVISPNFLGELSITPCIEETP